MLFKFTEVTEKAAVLYRRRVTAQDRSGTRSGLGRAEWRLLQAAGF